MTPSLRKIFLLLFLFTFSGFVSASMFHAEPVSGANPSNYDAFTLENQLTGKEDLKPVDNMHHFMEYVYGPVYGNLKEAMEKEPADKAGWLTVKSSSLILAETSILLSNRVPEKVEDAKVWKEASKTIHSQGSALYQAARKKDFATAQKAFAAMSDGCKNCHEAYEK